MPFTLIHGLISFLVVALFTKDRRLLCLAFIAGVMPDLDGIPVLFDLGLFYAIHHELLHPLIYSLLFAPPAAFIMRWLFQIPKIKSFAVFALSYALHPLADVLFTNWPVKLLWPFSSEQFSYPMFIEYNGLLVSITILGFCGFMLTELVKKK